MENVVRIYETDNHDTTNIAEDLENGPIIEVRTWNLKIILKGGYSVDEN